MNDKESGCHIHPYDRPRLIGEESFSGGFPHLHCRTCQNVLLNTIESLQSQLKRERELTDELISSAQVLATHHESHIGGKTRAISSVDHDIAAIHSEREGEQVTDELKEFLKNLWADHNDMQDTINTEHPDFISRKSEEYRCWHVHEKTKMFAEQLARIIDSEIELRALLKEAMNHMAQIDANGRDGIFVRSMHPDDWFDEVDSLNQRIGGLTDG